jgi:hypothetical protein
LYKGLQYQLRKLSINTSVITDGISDGSAAVLLDSSDFMYMVLQSLVQKKYTNKNGMRKQESYMFVAFFVYMRI